MYVVYKNDPWNGNCILRLMDNAWIPIEEINPSYQQYLKWIEEGNTPEEIDLGEV
jgi:hypothetical protein